MQPTHGAPKKGPKFLDTKMFIAASSIAVTVGLWNFFSNTALLDEIASQKSVQTAPAEAPAAAGQGFPPLPTLIPLVDVPVMQGNAAAPAGQISTNNLELRSVTAPDQVIVQKVKPVFDQPGAVVISVGGSSSSSKQGSVTVARSSR